MDDPLILDMAVHHFDLIRFVTGLEAEHGLARSWNPPWSQFAHDASATCVFAMAGGARIVYNGSWHPRGQFTDWNCRWLVECERGYMAADNLRSAEMVFAAVDATRSGAAVAVDGDRAVAAVRATR